MQKYKILNVLESLYPRPLIGIEKVLYTPLITPLVQVPNNYIVQAGETEFGGKSYWFSWNSDEAVLRNARWNWFTARNYCRYGGGGYEQIDK